MKIEEYIVLFKNEWKERFYYDNRILWEQYELRRSDYQESFLRHLDTVFTMCKKQQDAGKKGEISYICMHPLRASVRTRSYEYLIALYDEDEYEDRTETCTYWTPGGFSTIAEDSIQYFTNLLRKRCIRVPDCDINIFCESYLFKLLRGVPNEVFDSLSLIKKLDSFQNMNKSSECKLYLGEYMERMSELGKLS